MLLLVITSFISLAVYQNRAVYYHLLGKQVEFFDPTTEKIWKASPIKDDYIFRLTRSRGYHQPVATKENVSGKSVLVYENVAGYGDIFMLLPVAKLLKEHGAKRVIFEVPNKKYLPIVGCCSFVDQIVTRGIKAPFFDMHTGALSYIVRHKEIAPYNPYIHPQKELVAKWKKRLAHDKNLKVGICWQAGGTWDKKLFGASRSMQMNEMLQCAVPGVTLYSLQKLYGGRDVQKNGRFIAFDDLDCQGGPFMDTAALMKNLDLVITVDTSIVHLAGAIGVPVWIALIKTPCWRFFDYESKISPWYPSAKLFWQKDLGKWDDVIKKLTKELSFLAKS